MHHEACTSAWACTAPEQFASTHLNRVRKVWPRSQEVQMHGLLTEMSSANSLVVRTPCCALSAKVVASACEHAAPDANLQATVDASACSLFSFWESAHCSSSSKLEVKDPMRCLNAETAALLLTARAVCTSTGRSHSRQQRVCFGG